MAETELTNLAATLDEREAVIERGLGAFREVGDQVPVSEEAAA